MTTTLPQRVVDQFARIPHDAIIEKVGTDSKFLDDQHGGDGSGFNVSI